MLIIRKITRWLGQRPHQPQPYSLCYRPVESLAAFQALRACAEQQALEEGLGLARTPQGAVVPAPLP